jgi:branched-chain amino acid transport system permease protein
MSWDVLSGYTELHNFGHAFFVGVAAYLAGILNVNFGLSPILLIPIGGIISGLSGLVIGIVTLRLKGPYFALATMVVNGMIFKLVYILQSITGAEEGISGINTITSTVTGDLYVCLSITFICYFLLNAFTRSKYGLILKSTKPNVADAAEASGINTAFYRTLAFTISGFVAGIGGVLIAITSMSVGPTLIDGHYSVVIMLHAMVGGEGTIAGPLISGFLIPVLNEWLRFIDEYRHIITLGLLFALFYINPKGILNLNFLKRHRILRNFFVGKELVE